jgi:fructoselysine-6-P-deglycase FrlB-like protein
MRFDDGVRAQLAALAASRAVVSAALDGLPALKSGTVALVGIGASAMASRSAALAWREAGLSAFAVTAPELMAGGSMGIDLVVAISESGRSVETVTAIQTLDGVPTVGLTNDLTSPLADAADVAVPLGCGEDSPAYTVGYTATLQALGLIGESWSGRQTDWSALPGLAAAVLQANEAAVDGAAESLRGSFAIDIVAGARSEASAGEGALLLREVARVFTSAHETRSYLHGPMEALEPGSVGCVVFGNGREIQLARDTSRLGCPTLLVTALAEPAPAEQLSVARVPEATGLVATVLEVIPVQQLAWALSEARGLATGVFRNHQDDTKLS